MGIEMKHAAGETRIFGECPLECGCGLEPSRIVLPEGPLLECRHCGHLVSSADCKTYERNFQPFGEGNPIDRNPRVHIKRLEKVKRFVHAPPGALRLLDVGCNMGTFLHQAKSQGFQAVGVEPDRAAAEAGVLAGLDIKCGYLPEMGFGEASFQVVTLFEVIEHLTEPIALMRECRRILARTGRMFITTGNTRSWTVRFLQEKWDYFALKLGHISFFNPASMVKLAEKAGFEVVRIETRSVSAQNGSCPSALKRFARKTLGEGLNLPAKMFDRGHDMFVVLKKKHGE
jgi:2-polyprenyl-3-methyl-5-hydroxy-6-metoxy-1,4-benzoquinol methylase